MRALLLSVLVVGCSRPTEVVAKPDPAPSVKPKPTPSKGVLLRSCAPWDGPALEFRLGDGVSCDNPQASYLRVTLYRNLPIAQGKTGRWVFGTNIDNGHATRIVAGKLEELIGSVTLTHESDEKYRVELDLSTAKDGRIQETIELTLCPGTPLCG